MVHICGSNCISYGQHCSLDNAMMKKMRSRNTRKGETG